MECFFSLGVFSFWMGFMCIYFSLLVHLTIETRSKWHQGMDKNGYNNDDAFVSHSSLNSVFSVCMQRFIHFSLSLKRSLILSTLFSLFFHSLSFTSFRRSNAWALIGYCRAQYGGKLASPIFRIPPFITTKNLTHSHTRAHTHTHVHSARMHRHPAQRLCLLFFWITASKRYASVININIV